MCEIANTWWNEREYKDFRIFARCGLGFYCKSDSKGEPIVGSERFYAVNVSANYFFEGDLKRTEIWCPFFLCSGRYLKDYLPWKHFSGDLVVVVVLKSEYQGSVYFRMYDFISELYIESDGDDGDEGVLVDTWCSNHVYGRVYRDVTLNPSKKGFFVNIRVGFKEEYLEGQLQKAFIFLLPKDQ